MNTRWPLALFLIAGAVALPSRVALGASALTMMPRAEPLLVSVAQAQSALPAAEDLSPVGLARLAATPASTVAACVGGRSTFLRNTAERSAGYETKHAPGVDPLGARWSVAVFVYAKGQDAGDDLTRIASAGQRCRKRGVVSRDGVTWSVRHVGAATVAGGPWTGFRTRDAESTMMKQNPLRVTTTFWSRGNVLVEIQQVVPAGRSLRQADSWLSAAESRVLGVLSLDRNSSTPGAV